MADGSAAAQTAQLDSRPQITGMLWKLPTSGKNSRWVRRYFVVHDGFLLYYADRPSGASASFDPHVKGAFPLGGCLVTIYTGQLPPKQEDCGFAISHEGFGERSLVLAADSRHARDQWIAAVQDCRHVYVEARCTTSPLLLFQHACAPRSTYTNAVLGAQLIEKLRIEGRHARAQLVVLLEQLKQREELLSVEVAKRVAVQRTLEIVSQQANAVASTKTAWDTERAKIADSLRSLTHSLDSATAALEAERRHVSELDLELHQVRAQLAKETKRRERAEQLAAEAAEAAEAAKAAEAARAAEAAQAAQATEAIQATVAAKAAKATEAAKAAQAFRDAGIIAHEVEAQRGSQHEASVDVQQEAEGRKAAEHAAAELRALLEQAQRELAQERRARLLWEQHGAGAGAADGGIDRGLAEVTSVAGAKGAASAAGEGDGEASAEARGEEADEVSEMRARARKARAIFLEADRKHRTARPSVLLTSSHAVHPKQASPAHHN